MSDSSTARERILATPYELFTMRGINDVGVDELVGKGRRSEDNVVPALSVKGRPGARLPRRAGAAVHGWGGRTRSRSDYEACSFIKVDRNGGSGSLPHPSRARPGGTVIACGADRLARSQILRAWLIDQHRVRPVG